MANDTRVQSMIDLIQGNEAFMEAFKAISQHVAVETGDPSFARFSQALIEVSRQDVKPLFGEVKAASRPNKETSPRKEKAEVDNTWRGEQKDLFSGRGMQWVYLPLSLTSGVLDESDPVAKFMYKAGKAWVRYAGPRIVDGNRMAAFELRNEGSKVPAPKNLVYMPHEGVVGVDLNRLPDGKTPFALGLESDSPKDEDDAVASDEGVVIQLDNAAEEVIDEEMMQTEGDEEIDLDIF